jgi:uroporphyrinogen decarboxylase
VSEVNHRFLKALRREPVDCTPIWIMRQAGRYLPEYRKIREKAGDFMSLVKNPELACEVTLQPLARFPLDAAILFSDILTIPDAMNLGLYFAAGEGPCFSSPVRTAKAIQNLQVPEPEKLSYVMDAIRIIKRELANKVPLIGFSGSPWTLACYMVEGGASKEFAQVKGLAYSEPQVMHSLLKLLTESVISYIKAQIHAGVDTIMIFDTWGGVLTPVQYHHFSLEYMKKIVEALKEDPTTKHIPVILFTKNGGQWLEQIANTGCDAVGLDWTVDLAQARTRVGNKVALQGNLDPCVLYAAPNRIREEVTQVLKAYGEGPGHIFNLGHGIHQGVNPDHVAALVDAVHELSAR